MNKVKQLIRNIEVKARYCLIALGEIYQPKLQDEVIYQGKIYSISNGVAKPMWHLMLVDRDYAKPHAPLLVHRDNFKIRHTPKRLLFSFRSTYNFYMGNWYFADRQKPIGTKTYLGKKL